MYTVYFDSGTSNSRVYVLDGELNVVATGRQRIGSKDSALAGTNEGLLRALKSLYSNALEKAGITDAQVGSILASGMVTSAYGIQEIPHLVAPLPLTQLANQVASHRENRFFSREIRLVLGVRTGEAGAALSEDNIAQVNNMRGEEIELLGIDAALPEGIRKGCYAAINPGSHTHISLLRNGCLEDIFSTFSGELYHAIISGTVLGGAVCEGAPPDEEAAWKGYLALEEYGLNRALYICHAQKVFGVGDAARRNSFLTGILSGNLTMAIRNLLRKQWAGVQHVVIAQGGGSDILAYLAKRVLPEWNILELRPKRESFALEGACQILRTRPSPREENAYVP